MAQRLQAVRLENVLDESSVHIYDVLNASTGSFKGNVACLTEALLPPRGTTVALERNLQSAYRWLCTAQDASGDGGVAGLYNLLKGWGASYPETTGYIIPTFLHYGHFFNSPEARRRAIRMADWEVDVQLPSGAVRSGTLDVKMGLRSSTQARYYSAGRRLTLQPVTSSTPGRLPALPNGSLRTRTRRRMAAGSFRANDQFCSVVQRPRGMGTCDRRR